VLLELSRLLVQKNDIVWDIGANVGLFSVAASFFAGPAGEVVSVEADNWLVGLLRRTASLRNKDRQSPIEVVPCAVSSEETLAKFCIAERSRSSNALEGLGSTQMGGVREANTVMTIRLDWLLERRESPALIKVDVEGAETAVLSGATKLLSAVRPVVIIEVASENAAAVTSNLASAHYQLFDGDATLWFEHPVPKACWNTIAIPAERVQSVCLQLAAAFPETSPCGNRR
jgi:FkbM family methyltransferase